MKLKQALVEFKKDRISKQNARLSLANSVYDNPSMPRRKILLSVGAMNYRPPLERSKSAPKLGAIEELCSEEDEEEAEMNAKQNICEFTMDELCKSHALDRRRVEPKSRKLSCPDGFMGRVRNDSEESSETSTDELISLLVKESKLKADIEREHGTSQCDVEKLESRLTLESISENIEINDHAISVDERKALLLSQSNYLVTDSDDGSVSSGCETASTVTSSDAEPSSLPSHFPQEEMQKSDSDEERGSFGREGSFQNGMRTSSRSFTNSIHVMNDTEGSTASEEVNHVPIGEKNTFRRRSTYPPLRSDSSILTNLEGNFESLIDNLDVDSLNSSTETEVFKNTDSDNDSACSDESGYSEYLDSGKESIIGNTIMV